MDSFDWNKIRALEGSQAHGFEELCAQLARAECPQGARFDRKGSPDAGVECFSRLRDVGEWGWQAKYFDTLGNSQWSQLDGSVKKALDKHPALVRYYICVPVDRADARIPGQRSALERWDEHVNKWQAWAYKQGMNVEFIWWGSSELIDRLSQDAHIGRSFFWFGQRGFDQDWFELNLKIAVDSAGPRYTPPIHVNLPIAQDMERFGRSDDLIDEVKSHALGIRRNYQTLQSVIGALEQSLPSKEIDECLKTTDDVLNCLSQFDQSPFDRLPLLDISSAADRAATAGSQISRRIWELQRHREAGDQAPRTSRISSQDPSQDCLYYIQRLRSGLRELVDVCNHADSLANSQLLLLKGEGGAGKTHLLCDFATRRVHAKLPTILLMGQRFLSDDEPWAQLLQQLDLFGSSAEQFVGALESAAQASDCRALVIVDALNEGNGGKIWPVHLSSFVARLQRSPWIAVVISVRSSYEDGVIPGHIRDVATIVTHSGFQGQEYDAVKTFCEYYGLEFPSVPLMRPEFSNPLFLKTICMGLQHTGATRIPRGFHGITEVFNLYLASINHRLAKDLNYNPRDNLVRQALEKLSKLLVQADRRWLPRPLAEESVNELLRDRSFSESLYRGLVTEGVIVEDMGRGIDDPSEEVVFISYDRFADHIIANFILQNGPEPWSKLNASGPRVVKLRRHIESLLRFFLKKVGGREADPATNGLFEFLRTRESSVHRGLLEALCVQVPEHTGQELITLAPMALNFPGIGDAFLESIVWRKLDAFSDDTHSVLAELIEGEQNRSDPLDSFLTVSTVPGHYFNAKFLDGRLRQFTMAERDSWWSLYLHDAWETESPVDRLVNWASAVSTNDEIDDSVVELAGSTLAWMFTTSNRFLRDQATKALVTLLTDRIGPAMRLIDLFADVDDPYVTERVYAVAYGVAMRSHDPQAVGELASSVYDKVFVCGTPPVHILLRDYARGIIERAISLGGANRFDEQLIRPPYSSIWPAIPCEDCIEELFHNSEQAQWDGGNSEWSRNRIRLSVLNDDFSHYVIGGDSASNWLALGLEEEPWRSPEERRQSLLSRLSESERLAWEKLHTVQASLPPRIYWQRIDSADLEGDVVGTLPTPASPFDGESVKQALKEVCLLHGLLMAEFTDEHRTEWESIRRDEDDWATREGPRFDKKLIQRYILWRVFDLGWTTDRFGEFDRSSIGYVGRGAAKAERIGKKYQWIAYHEFLAYMSDHLQYREGYRTQDEHLFRGPWQEDLRDIDPSCTLMSTPGGTPGWTSGGPHNPSWWGKELYGAWQENNDHQDWLTDEEGIPEIEQLLEVVHPNHGGHWLNVNGSFVWRQPHPADQAPYDHNRREVWIGLTGFFVPAEETEAFMSWVESVDFWGGWMPEPQGLSSIYLGEYGCGPAFEHSYTDCLDFEDWVKPTSRDGKECPVSIQRACLRYLSESGGIDCSVEDSFILSLPHQEFINYLGLRWSCDGADYVDATGELAAFDPTAHENGPTALLMRKDLLERYLVEKSLTLCWVVLGEKWVVGGDASEKYHGRLKMSGAYRHTENGPVGFLNRNADIPEDNAGSSFEQPFGNGADVDTQVN